MVGFGLFGDISISKDSVRYFERVFDFLKDHNVNVTIYAGAYDAKTIATAIHHGGATRISGGFAVHSDPQIIDYLARHRVPIELAPTAKLLRRTETLKTEIGGGLFQLLLDNHLNVSLCSFRHALQPLTRSELLHRVYKQCSQEPGTENDVSHIFRLLGNAFRLNFSSFGERTSMYRSFVEQASAVLDGAGFKHYRSKEFYFPPDFEP